MLSVAQTDDFAAAWRRTWTGMDSDFLLHSLGGGAIIAAALTLARLLLDYGLRGGERRVEHDERRRVQQRDAEARLERILQDRLAGRSARWDGLSGCIGRAPHVLWEEIGSQAGRSANEAAQRQRSVPPIESTETQRPNATANRPGSVVREVVVGHPRGAGDGF